MNVGNLLAKRANRRSAPAGQLSKGTATAILAALALVAGVAALVTAPTAAITPAAASTGGMGVPSGSLKAAPTAPRPATRFAAPSRESSSTGGTHFGARVLRPGMRGFDVRVLNGIVKSKPYARRVQLNDRFHTATSSAIRRFQTEHSMRPTGIVNRRTAQILAGSMKSAVATWYGPGFYGNQTACGQTLRYGTVGVAHRNLPCGTRVTFQHKGRSVVTRVIDRGPFVAGKMWDLTNGARQKLGFSGSGPIRFAVAR